jgi:hypothetical protein
MGTSGNGRSNGSSRCFRRRGLFLDRQSDAIAHRVIPSVSKPRDNLCQRLLMGQWPATTTTQHHSSTRTIRSLCELVVPTGRNSCSQPIQANEDNELSPKHDPTHDRSHRVDDAYQWFPARSSCCLVWPPDRFHHRRLSPLCCLAVTLRSAFGFCP